MIRAIVVFGLGPLVILSEAKNLSAFETLHSAQGDNPPHVVFLTGDEEYRSEESMPMLAKILKRDYGLEVTVCYSLNEEGYIDPNARDNVTGIEVLADADLMVLFTRFRDLPPEQFRHFLDYVKTGKPIVGFRTATHAFKFDKHPQFREWGWKGEKIAGLLGQNWITHHGHFGDGHERLTDVRPVQEMKDHPILRGVEPFKAYSWLYHVHGGEDKLRGDARPLMTGTALKSNKKGQKDRYPPTQPTAWIKTYRGEDGNIGRVFMCTTAHPYDFKIASMRTLALNGILWAVRMEEKIPPNGADPTLVDKYDPNNSGFGNKFKPNRKPEDI